MIQKRTASQIGRSNVNTAKVHERRVANLLTDWSGSEFRRRRIEGRMADTISRDLTGDIIPVDRDCHFNIECKKRKDMSLDALMASPKTAMFTKCWHQCNYDATLCAENAGRRVLPLMFFKPIPNWDWIAISVKAAAFLRRSPAALGKRMSQDPVDWEVVNRLWFPHLLFDEYEYYGAISHNIIHTRNDKNKVEVPLQLDPCFICRWKCFATNVDPASFFVKG